MYFRNKTEYILWWMWDPQKVNITGGINVTRSIKWEFLFIKDKIWLKVFKSSSVRQNQIKYKHQHQHQISMKWIHHLLNKQTKIENSPNVTNSKFGRRTKAHYLSCVFIKLALKVEKKYQGSAKRKEPEENL